MYCKCGCGKLAPIAKATKTSKGHTKGQPMHYIKGHQNVLRARTDLKAAFEENVYPDPNTGCFIWAGPLLRNGYGRFSIAGRTVPAHRAHWELVRGPVPVGEEVMHVRCCMRRDCVNLDHLALGSHQDNMFDKYSYGQRRRGAYPLGVRPNGRGFSGRVSPPGAKGKTLHLGTFATIEEAAAVVAAKRAELLADYRHEGRA